MRDIAGPHSGRFGVGPRRRHVHCAMVRVPLGRRLPLRHACAGSRGRAVWRCVRCCDQRDAIGNWKSGRCRTASDSSRCGQCRRIAVRPLRGGLQRTIRAQDGDFRLARFDRRSGWATSVVWNQRLGGGGPDVRELEPGRCMARHARVFAANVIAQHLRVVIYSCIKRVGRCSARRPHYFVGTSRFSSSNQLRTTTIDEELAVSSCSIIRNRPSGATS
jgi:hypothetical protein